MLESNDWDNQPATRDYLYNKQLAACHAFEIEIAKCKKVQPKAFDFSWALRSWGKTPWNRDSSINKVLDISMILGASSHSLGQALNAFPTLNTKFKEMVNAKQTYETNGGNYK